MKKSFFKSLRLPILCTCAILLLMTLTACRQAPEAHEAIPVQGVFSNGTDQEDPLFSVKTVHFSLLDTGKYYIMNAGGDVKESGQCEIDKDGFGHLHAEQSDPDQPAESGYFLRVDHDRYLLITGAGDILYMKQIDTGGRAPASEAPEDVPGQENSAA